jgi:hypothetical protein
MENLTFTFFTGVSRQFPEQRQQQPETCYYSLPIADR